MRRSAASVRPTSSSSSSARPRRSASPYRPHWSSSSSRPVCTGSSPISWRATPIRLRTSAPSSTTSRSATRALPDVGGRSVHSIRTAVVLPAPLGPRTPNTTPGSMVRSSERTASMPPLKLRVRARASMALAESIAARTLATLRLLHRPAVAVGVAEEDEPAPVEVLHIADLDTAPGQLLARRFRIVHAELEALDGPRPHLAQPGADRDRAGGARWRELHESDGIADHVIVVRVEAGLLGVEGLGPVHVGYRHLHELELP